MRPKLVLPGLYSLSIKMTVNAFFIEEGRDVTLIDTGFPDSAPSILEAAASLGHEPQAIKHIIVTHCHNDHSGSLAELKERTGATCYMHAVDAALIREGKTMRPCVPAPTVVGRMFHRKFIRDVPLENFDVAPVEVDREIEDGEDLTVAGGVRVAHAPGHCAGQVVLLWRSHGGVLIAADVAANAFGLGLSPVYEDLELGLETLARIGELEFEHACFGHGRPLKDGAAKAFREKWPTLQSKH